MTLDTKIILEKPTNVREVFDYARSLIGATEAHKWEHETESYGHAGYDPQYMMQPGQDLCGWLMVRYGADGPLQRPSDKWPEDYPDDNDTTPHGAIMVSLDTGYAYRADNGAGCSDLHAAFVSALGEWLDARGVPWQWQNEFTGEWYAGEDKFDALDAFGDLGKGFVALMAERVA